MTTPGLRADGLAVAPPPRQRHTAPVSNAPSGNQPPDLDPADRPAATPSRTLHMIGNAHLDPVWLWPWQEGYQEARATFWPCDHVECSQRQHWPRSAAKTGR